MEYFTFGMKCLRITQNYYGTTSHKPHWYKSKNYADYPIDCAGKDGGQDIYYSSCSMKVNAIRTEKQGYSNTIWLESTDKVMTPSGEHKVFIMLTHWNNDDEFVRNLGEGKVISAGTPICREGTSGASANHLHIVVGNADLGTGNNLIKNSNGKWVSNGYCMKPEELMYIDRDFTSESWGGCLVWRDKPKVEYYPTPNYNGVSIVDGLKSIGVDASFFNRKKIANKNGIKNYIGTANQNKQLLNLLKSGKLVI